MSLAELEARVKRELDFVSYPARPWMQPRAACRISMFMTL